MVFYQTKRFRENMISLFSPITLGFAFSMAEDRRGNYCVCPCHHSINMDLS